MFSKEDIMKSEDNIQSNSKFESSDHLEKELTESKKNPPKKSKGSSCASGIMGLFLGACIGGIRAWGFDELARGIISIEILIDALIGALTGGMIGLIAGILLSIVLNSFNNSSSND